ncbi:LysM peptidoglycan-binding domain-containing protein [Reyranella aquatilis]|uniref:LysM peptidoglycan-binding domain-containing protein n=1 Tax=Reyranella aquatilis TaxID=2035356 RepID=A0ABS8L0B6_9HYPH|nr:LysM peptidoglycan-binding domain-containing protein [Reyranella aquatilis]MCC8431786.1 LysM peptidoglycan-binding domain-containing protein [Reyranella aquatilis]
MSRTVFGLVAVGAVVIAIALGVAWRGKMTEQAAIDRPAQVLGTAASGGPATTAAANGPTSGGTGSAPAGSPAGASPTVTPPTNAGVPTFDVARIGTDGRAVIAGRAAPGAKIVLLDGGREIAKAESDARGEWVVIVQDPPLSVGQHELRVVQHIEGKAPLTSEQSVVAVVPEPPAASASAQPRAETLVMISPPTGVATVVQPPTTAGLPKSADLSLSTVDYDDQGHVTVSGLAAPGTVVRGYVNDKMVAEGVAAADGRWRLRPAEPVAQGKHLLRLDRIAQDGRPVARLELPFERVVVAPVSNSDARRLHIVKGDNLWNIAQAHYGAGWHHTVIFAANKDQVKNPDLIYPGQILSLPKVN